VGEDLKGDVCSRTHIVRAKRVVMTRRRQHARSALGLTLGSFWEMGVVSGLGIGTRAAPQASP
jgi:hypothetical protein